MPTRNLRVLHVIESLGVAGAEQSLVNLLPYLTTHGFDCEVAALSSPYDLAPPLREQGIAVHELDISSRWKFVRGAVRLRDIIREGDFDLVHAHLPEAVFYVAIVGGQPRDRLVSRLELRALSCEHFAAQASQTCRTVVDQPPHPRIYSGIERSRRPLS